MENLILIKLGGSLITDKKKDKSIKMNVLKQLCVEISEAQKIIRAKIIIGNGGGSYSHPPSKKYNISAGYQNKKSLEGISEVQDLGSQLNRIVVREFINNGIPAISLNPSSCVITKNSQITSFFLQPLFHALDIGMMPVVYGDVIFDSEIGCSDISTEKIFNYLALNLKEYLKVRKIVYCGLTDGVYDDEGNVIRRITNNSFKRFSDNIGPSEGIDTTGGMLHKVKEALVLAEQGVDSVIIKGSKKGNLYNLLTKKSYFGTLVTNEKQTANLKISDESKHVNTSNYKALLLNLD